MIILHLEDDPLCASMFAAQVLFYAPGATLLQAKTLAVARAHIANAMPSFAVLDVQVPDGRGFDLLPLLNCLVVFVSRLSNVLLSR